MRIAFLLHNAYAIGGTVRTTFNLASALADRGHTVEIASLMRHRDCPRLPLDTRVRLVPLTDLRASDAADPSRFLPSAVFPSAERRYGQYSRLHDLRAQAYLRDVTADVVIGTRPGLNVYLARFGSRRATRIAQEHLSLSVHSTRLRAQLAPHYRRLDALVTTTEADAADYRARMTLPGVRVSAVPNPVPDPGVAPHGSAGAPDAGNPEAGNPVVAAVGRLTRSKRFDVLIEAFATVADRHPEWRLRIYGGGERSGLQALIDELDLAGHATLMGACTPIEPELAKASLLALSSDTESFGMALVEAMRCGVPAVATDCPHGPGEIIDDGVDGRLVPVRDRDALADALCALIEDEPARRRMAEAARRSAARFDPTPIALRHEEMFEQLAASRTQRARERRRAALRARLRRWAGRPGLRVLLRARRGGGRQRRPVRGET
ncbi:glycosyltransferase family 4 protein [Streptomyces sp. NPDC048172]|uniref:glycosyltransferase family 4 protein n=1 Tax=Streptomyces sp. NPDC048172 TaxID=3365505 RepID=UPI00371CD615